MQGLEQEVLLQDPALLLRCPVLVKGDSILPVAQVKILELSLTPCLPRVPCPVHEETLLGFFSSLPCPDC